MAAILYSFMVPSAEDADDFYGWYEAEHVPGRLTVPGFDAVERYRAGNGDPTGLLLYRLRDLGVLGTPTYKAHQAATSERTAARMGSLDRFVRVTASVILSLGDVDVLPRHLFVVGFDCPPGATAELDRWYGEEHGPMLLKAARWQSVRLLDVAESNAPLTRVALHGLDDLAALDSSERAAAGATPWRGRLSTEEWFQRSERHVLTATTNLAERNVAAR